MSSIYESTVYLCSPTNSTMFTTCCHVAICDDERRCPVCDEEVHPVGKTSHETGTLRWGVAFRGGQR